MGAEPLKSSYKCNKGVADQEYNLDDCLSIKQNQQRKQQSTWMYLLFFLFIRVEILQPRAVEEELRALYAFRGGAVFFPFALHQLRNVIPCLCHLWSKTMGINYVRFLALVWTGPKAGIILIPNNVITLQPSISLTMLRRNISYIWEKSG